jgi:hypothetical protein
MQSKQTVQVEGVAEVLSGDALNACKQEYFKAWPDGCERESWTDIVYIRVRPRWLRYSDFSQTPPRIEELTLSR